MTDADRLAAALAREGRTLSADDLAALRDRAATGYADGPDVLVHPLDLARLVDGYRAPEEPTP